MQHASRNFQSPFPPYFQDPPLTNFPPIQLPSKKTRRNSLVTTGPAKMSDIMKPTPLFSPYNLLRLGFVLEHACGTSW